jgi:hypothetical protein
MLGDGVVVDGRRMESVISFNGGSCGFLLLSLFLLLFCCPPCSCPNMGILGI